MEVRTFLAGTFLINRWINEKLSILTTKVLHVSNLFRSCQIWISLAFSNHIVTSKATRSSFGAHFSFVDDLLPLHWRETGFDCSIHVRRGDYLQRRHEFVPLHLDYYERAIRHMQQQGCQTFLVFSDDIQWCKLNLNGECTFVEGLTDIQSLCLMSRCKNHIIANSTFSWWGSWLAEGSDTSIIAPQTWYAFRRSLRKDDHYQYCPSWQLIANEVSLFDQIASLMQSQDKRHFIQSYLDRKKWLEEEYEANIKNHTGA